MESSFAKAVASKAYVDAAAGGAGMLFGGVDDLLSQSVTEGSGDAGSARYVGSVAATLAGGNAVRGVTAGIEIASRVNAITGATSVFMQRLTGAYGGVSWLTAFDSLSAYEVAENQLNADPDFITFIDSTGGCYVEGSGESVLWMKVD